MKECNIFSSAGIPEHRNAFYQRSLYLSKRFHLHVYTHGNAEIAPLVLENSTVHRCPFSFKMLKQLKTIGFLIEKVFFTLWIIFQFINKNDFFIYTFHAGGFTAAGLLKVIKGGKIKWVADMQHTPFYHYEDSKRKEMSLVKKMINRPLGLLYLAIGKTFLPMADMVSAMSYDYGEGFAHIFETEFRVEKEKLLPVPNGVNLEKIARVVDDPEKCRFDVPVAKTIFAYAGNIRLERLKPLKEFIETYRGKEGSAVLLLCGAMPQDALAYYSKIKEDYFVRMGMIPHTELLKLYKETDVVLAFIDNFMRDHDYSHPGKVFEALAMGKLLVVSDLQSIRNVVKDGYNGLIFDGRDMDGLCDRIVDIINSPELRREIEDNARKSIGFLDWKAIHEKWFSRIHEVVSK